MNDRFPLIVWNIILTTKYILCINIEGRKKDKMHCKDQCVVALCVLCLSMRRRLLNLPTDPAEEQQQCHCWRSGMFSLFSNKLSKHEDILPDLMYKTILWFIVFAITTACPMVLAINLEIVTVCLLILKADVFVTLHFYK